jgi:hypothetical protein
MLPFDPLYDFAHWLTRNRDETWVRGTESAFGIIGIK